MIKIAEDTFFVGGSNNSQMAFEGVLPLTSGMNYNSYLIIDAKTCLFDTVDESIKYVYLANLVKALGKRELDYLVIHHLEPDHTGAVLDILKMYKKAVIKISSMGLTLLKQFFDVNDYLDRIEIIKEGDELSLGKHKISFISAPMVHWPEVMMSYDQYTKVLYSADAFGSFGAVNDNIFDDEYDLTKEPLEASRRYYTNIVGKYGPQVQDVLNKASKLDIKIIAPLHGVIYRKNLKYILDKYELWANYQKERDGVLIVATSIYGHTLEVAKKVQSLLADKGIDTDLINLNKTDVSFALSKSFIYENIILCAPTFNMGLFPPMEIYLNDLKAHLIANKNFYIIENGSWAPQAGRIMKSILSELKSNNIYNEITTIKSSLKDSDLEKLESLVKEVSMGCCKKCGCKKEEQPKLRKWKCKICGFVYEGVELPKDFHCPVCGHPASDFEEVKE